METIWEQNRPTMLERVAVLERAADRATAGALTPDLEAEARTAAHQLAGSVGTFGYARASELARELERRIETGTVAGAGSLVAELRGALATPPFVASVRRAEPNALPLVLFVTPDDEDLQRLRVEAGRRGLRSRAVATAAEARAGADGEAPAAVVVYGHAALQALGDLEAPVLLVADDETLAARLAAIEAGATGFLPPGSTAAEILDDVGFVLQSAETAVPRVLAVGAAPELAGVDLRRLDDTRALLEELVRFAPALLILNTADAPGVCTALRADRRWAALAIVVVGDAGAPGADDVVAQDGLAACVRARLERARTHASLAEVEPLTGAGNRRASGAALGRLLRIAERHELPFCLVVIELGDADTARGLGTLLRRGLRGEDVVGRWDEQTFVLGMAGVGRAAAVDRIDGVRMRSGLAFSAGVAQYPADGPELGSLFDAAERALHSTRHADDDQVVGAGTGSAEGTRYVDVAIIEDEDATASLIDVSLTGRGRRCWRFSNGAGAIAMLSGEQPLVRAGVILLDLNLPAVGGIELLTLWARDGLLRTSQVIVVSANADPVTVERARELGARDYIVKPVDLPSLAERVDEALGRRR